MMMIDFMVLSLLMMVAGADLRLAVAIKPYSALRHVLRISLRIHHHGGGLALASELSRATLQRINPCRRESNICAVVPFCYQSTFMMAPVLPRYLQYNKFV